MSQALKGQLTPEQRGLVRADRVPVDELLAQGMSRVLVCDTVYLRTDGCACEVPYDGGELPEGWTARTDPWGRKSRFGEGTLMLHLCPACAPAEAVAA